MRLFGITGWKNSGKTTLMVNIVSELRRRNYSVATIKHAHHEFDIDQPGKDSFRHRTAGASQVIVASSKRWALVKELDQQPEPTLDQLLAKLDPVDFVIVEGFKRSPHPKLAVVRPDHNAEPLPDAEPLLALASDQSINAIDYGCNGPVFPLTDVKQICDFIVENANNDFSA
ncbi:molybdopterin-guanine dinucleotide biosynthesis protein B [Aurantivibrio plasticivorans]